MHNSSPSEIISVGSNEAADDEEEYVRNDVGSTFLRTDSISSTRNSFSSPRNLFGSESLNVSPSREFSLLSNSFQKKKTRKSRRKAWYREIMAIGFAVFMAVLLLVNWLMLSRIEEPGVSHGGMKLNFLKANSSSVLIQEELQKLGRAKKTQRTTYGRLLSKASHALAEEESKPEPKDLWAEPYSRSSSWTPCAHIRNWKPIEGKNGYLMVTANGGINQQRVAVCNAVAIARFLNAILVLPKLLYSSVWRDASQFSDIYQEEHFINYLMDDIPIVKELPKEFLSLDLEAIGSVVTDADVVKEAKLSFYSKHILPILHRNKVVQFVGFGNRLASDPIPRELQRLRCRCNFHALRFVPKIQEAGALLIQRMRQNVNSLAHLDHYLVGPFAKSTVKGRKTRPSQTSRYLALHLRFEIDMVAHSLCEFGGGEEETLELEAYRKVHFPALLELKKKKKFPSPTELKSEGLCPLMPDETVLMLVALGFKQKTHIYLAGAHIYGGQSRLAALTTLFPNLVTKENLLSATEIEPFANFSSQLAALDFIVCTAADVFSMTDPGSQFSSLVAGYRIYYGAGKMPTIRPNKRRLADIFVRNNTIQWKTFEMRVRKAVRQNKRVFSRPFGRSIYRYPRCRDCMCYSD